MPNESEIDATTASLIQAGADLLALPIQAGQDGPIPVTSGLGLDPTAFDSRLPAPLADLLKLYEFTGKPGEIVEFPVDLGEGLTRLALLGIGSAAPAELRKAGAALARQAKGRHRAGVIAASWEGAMTAEGCTAFTEGALLAGYTYTWAGKPKGPKPASTIRLVSAALDEIEPPLRRGRALAGATALARDLSNTPSAEKDPAWIVAQAQAQVAAEESGLTCEVWDEEALARDGFGAILGVGQGSPRPPRLVQLTYEPQEPDRHVVLIGKGITFDTGGLSLKPSDNMKSMKTDMSGAAVVLAAMSRLAAMGSRAKVTGLLALAENAFSSSAQRPSDVVTTYSGRTVEILNTDAEGRLVLADALGYAAEKLSPDALVDVATLTGAAKLALGTGIGALYATDDALAGALLESGDQAGERLWRMPLFEQYADSLSSPVADLANIGTNPDYGRPGATEAALFLRDFAAGIPWAHLDIAGPARAASDDGEITKGGTGFATRLLLRWLTAD